MSDKDNATTTVLSVLDAMTEAWVEKHGIAQAIRSVPLGLPTEEFRERAYALILRHVKQAYAEGLYTGHTSTIDEIARRQTAGVEQDAPVD